MREAPVALDVDQPHAAAGAAGPLPGGAGADAAGRRVEVPLATAQVVRRAGGGKRDRRLVVGELHDRVLAQAVGQVGVDPGRPGVDAEVAAEVRGGPAIAAPRARAERGERRPGGEQRPGQRVAAAVDPAAAAEAQA